MTPSEILPANWRDLKIEGFMGLLGPLLRSTRPGESNLFGLQTREAHRNPNGQVHGGVLTSLLDHVIAIEGWQAAGRRPTVTVQMDTRFLGAVQVGDLLEVRANVRQAGRSLIFVDADVCCGDRQIASATAVMKISSMASKPDD